MSRSPRGLRFAPALRERIAANLATFDHRAIDDPALRPAAVAIAVVGNDAGEACFLLTFRPPSMNRHGGQFALPGGKVDADERALDTARREFHEELGLPLPPHGLLGVLDDFGTRSGFRMRPFVFWVDDATELRPDPREVASVHRIPIADLCRPGVPTIHAAPAGEQPLLSMHIEALGDRIYAPTAAILYQFREVGIEGCGTRVAHFEQPAFAWR